MIRSDVEEFEAALAAGDLERAVAHYAGPFLDGVHLRDAPEFERWVDQERDRLSRLFLSVLERLARSAEEQADAQTAVRWWRRLAAADPTSASAAASLMKALIAAGDGGAALSHARVYTATLVQELGSAPDPAIVALEQQTHHRETATARYWSPRDCHRRTSRLNDPRDQPPAQSIDAYTLFAEGMNSFLEAALASFNRRGPPEPADQATKLYSEAARKFEAAAALDTMYTLPLIWAAFAWRNGDFTDEREHVYATWKACVIACRQRSRRWWTTRLPACAEATPKLPKPRTTLRSVC